jgi:hypothetical protein
MKNENKTLKPFRVRFVLEETIYAPNAEKAAEKFGYDHGINATEITDVYQLPPAIGED